MLSLCVVGVWLFPGFFFCIMLSILDVSFMFFSEMFLTLFFRYCISCCMGFIFFWKEVVGFSVSCLRSFCSFWFKFPLILLNSSESFTRSLSILSLNVFVRFGLLGDYSLFKIRLRCVIFYYSWSFVKLIFRVYPFLRDNIDCSIQTFLCFCCIRVFKSIFYSVQN